MIVRDSRNPRGRDEGAVARFEISQLEIVGGGLGYGVGQKWNGSIVPQTRTTVAATEHRIVYVRRDPAGHDFKAANPAQKWCSDTCKTREWYRHKLARERQTRFATCHEDRKHYSIGLCKACYRQVQRQRLAA